MRHPPIKTKTTPHPETHARLDFLEGFLPFLKDDGRFTTFSN